MNATRETIRLPDLPAMAALGSRIARQIRPGDVVALTGGLGTGKTTLARAVLAELGHEGEVPSPSFTIIETYDAPPLRVPVVHADFYRLEDPSELAEIGLDEYRMDAALIAEWPDHAGGFDQEAACLSITLEVSEKGAEDGRIAIVEGGPDWVGRMP